MLAINIKNSTWVKINCILTTLVVLLMILLITTKSKSTEEATLQEVNPCCAFPCQNGGICVTVEKGFLCDCTEIGYFGKYCETPTIRQLLKNCLEYHPTTVPSGILGTVLPAMWRMINYFSLFQRMFNKNLYTITSDWGRASFKWISAFDFGILDFYDNLLLSARSLPPTPKVCPTPMGFSGPKQLPDIDEVFERVFRRKQFLACPKRTNLLFAAYLQHFASQFDNFEKRENWVTNILDMSHVYGKTEVTANQLREFRGGLLKTSIRHNEEYPPLLHNCPQVQMVYPETPFEIFARIADKSGFKAKWALGNPQLSMTPMLFVLSTIWIREHNRVCKVLSKKHINWTDDELYHTARLIVTGEVIKITLTEVMKHMMQSQMTLLYKPEFIFDLNIQHTGCVPKEVSLLPHWHCLMPDMIRLGTTSYNISNILYSDNNIIFQHGLENVIHAMSITPAGEITRQNVGVHVKKIMKKLLRESRTLKIQSYNNYRKRFGLKPKLTFEELTGDLQLAAVLKELYVDVDAVELIVGFLSEQKGTGIAPPTLTSMGGSWLIRGLLSHPINSPDWWKPSTFGGELGMNIIKSASLKKLICLNLKNKCINMHVDLKIPRKIPINKRY